MCIYDPTYLFICLIYLPVCLFVYLSVCLSIYLSIYPCMDPSIHVSIYPSIYLSIYGNRSIYLSIHLSIYLCIYKVGIFRIPTICGGNMRCGVGCLKHARKGSRCRGVHRQYLGLRLEAGVPGPPKITTIMALLPLSQSKASKGYVVGYLGRSASCI